MKEKRKPNRITILNQILWKGLVFLRILKFLLGKRKDAYTIIKFDNNEISSLIEQITTIDKQIQRTSNAIIEAQVVRVRSLLSREANIFNSFQKKIVVSKATSSVEWHQKQLFMLNQHRKELQIKLDTLTGETWRRRIDNIIRTIEGGII